MIVFGCHSQENPRMLAITLTAVLAALAAFTSRMVLPPYTGPEKFSPPRNAESLACAIMAAGISTGVYYLSITTGTFNGAIPLWIGMATVLAWEDLKSQSVPNGLTIWGGLVLLLCAIIEQGGNPYTPLLGVIAASGSLYVLSKIGKLLVKPTVLEFEEPALFSIDSEAKKITIGPETEDLALLFQEGSGTATLLTPEGDTAALISEDGRTNPSPHPTDLMINKILLPRDVIGQGDIKAMIGLGATLGPQGALFALFCGCLYGAVLGIPLRKKNGRIPFFPFLFLGGVTYAASGPTILKLMGW
jgi:prepilin signal peptidase PulO-like enzyme (type II secretory pathway)